MGLMSSLFFCCRCRCRCRCCCCCCCCGCVFQLITWLFRKMDFLLEITPHFKYTWTAVSKGDYFFFNEKLYHQNHSWFLNRKLHFLKKKQFVIERCTVYESMWKEHSILLKEIARSKQVLQYWFLSSIPVPNSVRLKRKQHLFEAVLSL